MYFPNSRRQWVEFYLAFVHNSLVTSTGRRESWVLIFASVLSGVYSPLRKLHCSWVREWKSKEKRCLDVAMETGLTLGISMEGFSDTRPLLDNCWPPAYPHLPSPDFLFLWSNSSFGWESGDSLGHSLYLILVFCFERIHVALGKSFHISGSQFAI